MQTRDYIGISGYIWAMIFLVIILVLPGSRYSYATIYYIFGYLIATFFLVYFVYAPRNLFFTFVSEGTNKFVDRSGKIIATLLQLVGHDIEEQPKGDIVESSTKKRFLGLLGPWNIWGGLWFYGLWPICDIHIYEFEWYNIDEKGVVKHHEKRWIDYMMVKMDAYWQQMPTVESADLVPLDIELIQSMRIKNPYNARFMVRSWLSVAFDYSIPRVRDGISKENYSDLQKRPNAKTELGKAIFDEMQDVVKEIAEFGVDLIKIGFKDLNPTPEYRAQTTKAYVAERDAEVIKITAEANADAVVIKATAEAKATKIMNEAVKEYGDLGRFLEAIRAAKSPGDVSGTLRIYLLPEIAKALQGKDLSEDNLKKVITEAILSDKNKLEK